MTKIIDLIQIKEILTHIDIIPEIEKGFIAYSNGQATIPPVGELLFEEKRGEVHIKYGYINHDDFYVVKVASGFFENFKFNLPSSNGVMLIFSSETGALLGVLLDEGYLTDVRTAAAGAVVAKYFAPKKVHRIGIVGAGTQAMLQLSFLKNIIHCKEVVVWSRNSASLQRFKSTVREDYSVVAAESIDEITDTCNYIITATPSVEPLIWENQIKGGTHITAVGADSPHKQELDPLLFKKADIIVADSITQCIERGDIAHAVKNNMLEKIKIIELGHVITGASGKRVSDEQLTIADLTGVAVQDIQIAKCVYNQFSKRRLGK